MSQKNETAVLVLSTLVTFSLAGAGFWWFSSLSGGSKESSIKNTTEKSIPPTPLIPSTPTSPFSSSNAVESNAETFASVKNVPKGLFNYGGSTTWAPIRRDVDTGIQTVWPQFRLRYTHPNSGTVSSGSGIRMLLDNQLSFAQSSSPLQDKDYEQAQQRGFALKEVPVAIDAFAVVVHPSLKISGLSVERLNDIYAGKITNWNQVGGPNLKIKPYRKGSPEPGSYLEFAPTTTEALRKVAIEPGAIFQASVSLLISQCNVKLLPLSRTNSSQLISPYKEPLASPLECQSKGNQLNKEALLNGEYPITRRLFIIIKQNNQLDQQGGEAYANLMLTEQGQDLIEKAGFLRIR